MSADPSLEETLFHRQVNRLHQLTVYGRWLLVGFLWLTLGLLSLWGLRSEIALWNQYFTWTAVRYALAYHRLSALGLGLCIGMTASVLVWQTRNILVGIPNSYKQRLEKQVLKIRQQGNSHPLWRWVIDQETQNT